MRSLAVIQGGGAGGVAVAAPAVSVARGGGLVGARKNVNEQFSMLALEPVWVPNEPAEPGAVVAVERKGRAKNEGPNGEPADSGKWKLKLPEHLGGGIYNGPTISASALETYSECPEKWGFSRLNDLDKPTSDSAARGGERHTELERWLKKGIKPTTEGMSKVINHFPMPGRCESESYAGIIFGRPGHEIVFAGYLDARESILDDRIYVEDADGVIDVPMNSVIRDLKTTGDFRWKKTAAQLSANLQAALYALFEILRVEAAQPGRTCDAVILKWTYALIKPNGTITRVETVSDDGSFADPQKARGVLLTREQAVATVAQYLPLAEKMIEAIEAGERGEITAKDLPKNGDACSAYGGCPWKKIGVCEVPSGGGFLSQLKQARARVGLEVVAVKRLGAAVEMAAEISTKTTTTSGEKMTSTGMAARFAKKNGTNVAPAAVAKPTTVTAKPAAATKPAPVAAKPAAPASSSGMASRFAKKTTEAPAPAEVSKIEVKATADGMASKAVPSNGKSAGAGGGTLLTRLQGLVKPGQQSALSKAAADAPTHAVGESVLAVGINPPDAAPEWTQEEQAAEAAKLPGAKDAAKEAVARAALPADGEPAKRGRGRPRKDEAAQDVALVIEGTIRPAGPYSLASAVTDIDQIVARLMAGGFRTEAGQLLVVGGSFAGRG